jgi:hypothetical protein
MPDKNAIPNKCDYCGLRATTLPETSEAFREIRELYDKKIISQKFERKINIDDPEKGNVDEFCLLSKPEWKDGSSRCDSWQLDIGLDKSDYISIHYSNESEKLSRRSNLISKIALYFSGIATAIGIISLINYIFKY